MTQVAAPGAFAGTRSIHKQNKAIVGADVHDKFCRQVGQVECFAEMKNAGVSLRRVGARNPLRRPTLPGPLAVCRGLPGTGTSEFWSEDRE